MIPVIVNDGLEPDFEEVIEPSKNYRLDLGRNRVVGFVVEIEAVKQAIFLMLSVERFEHIIYSWNFGREFKDLYGKPAAYVASEAPRRIADCLLQDDRITAVDSFEATIQKKRVHIAYVARTIYGDIPLEVEVFF